MPAPLAFVFVLLGLLLFVLDGLTVAAARGGNNNNSFNNFNKPNQFHRDNDPYQVLGVKRTASDDEIQKSYRKRAKETHRTYYLCEISLFSLSRLLCLRESLISVYLVSLMSSLAPLCVFAQPTRTFPPMPPTNSDASPPRSKY